MLFRAGLDPRNRQIEARARSGQMEQNWWEFFFKRWELETLVVFLSHHFSEVLNNLIICTSAYRRVLSKSIIKILSNSPKEIQDPPEKNREKYQVAVVKNTGPQLLDCLCAFDTQSLLHSVFRDVWCMHCFFWPINSSTSGRLVD